MHIDRDRNGRRYKTFNEVIKDHDKTQDFMIKCKCSHTILFTGMKDRICCSHCGHWVYKDKKTEMRYKMKELLK